MVRLNGVPDHSHEGEADGGDAVRPNQLGAPEVASVEEVEDPQIGDMVYVEPNGSSPEGRWRYTESGWLTGATNPRNTLNISQREIGGQSSRTLTRFTLPDPEVEGLITKLAVWQVLANTPNGGGGGGGGQQDLFVRVLLNGDVVAQDEADDPSLQQTNPGTPLAFVGSAGDLVEVVAENDNGGQTTLTGFATISTEFAIPTEEP